MIQVIFTARFSDPNTAIILEEKSVTKSFPSYLEAERHERTLLEAFRKYNEKHALRLELVGVKYI